MARDRRDSSAPRWPDRTVRHFRICRRSRDRRFLPGGAEREEDRRARNTKGAHSLFHETTFLSERDELSIDGFSSRGQTEARGPRPGTSPLRVDVTDRVGGFSFFTIPSQHPAKGIPTFHSMIGVRVCSRHRGQHRD